MSITGCFGVAGGPEEGGGGDQLSGDWGLRVESPRIYGIIPTDKSLKLDLLLTFVKTILLITS